jgi:hypothetical protein
MSARFTFREACYLVDLSPKLWLSGIPLFEVHRARLTSKVFLDIYTKLHVNYQVYGDMPSNGEMRSRVIAPVALHSPFFAHAHPD